MKRLLTVTLTLLVIALQGCVYLRLLEVKGQFAKYEDYFSADLSDGLTLNFHKPVLLEKDLSFLGLFPNEVVESGDHHTWKLVFEKKYSDGQSEPEDFSIRVDLELDSQGKLTSVHINDRYFAFFSKEEFLSILKSFGGAKIDMKQRTATAQTEDRDTGEKEEPLMRSELIEQLGIPFSTTEDNTLEYRYLQKHPLEQNPDGTISQKSDVYTAQFRFDVHDRLTSITGTFPFIGKLTVQLQYVEEE